MGIRSDNVRLFLGVGGLEGAGVGEKVFEKLFH